MENKIKELINEFRLRIRNLDTYPEDNYFLELVNLAYWLFKLKEFEPAFKQLEEKKNLQNQILNEAGNKLFEEIKKQWKVLKKYITKKILSKLSKERFNLSNENTGAKFFVEGDKDSKFKLLRMEQMIEEKVRFYVVDAYHELRLLTEQIYHSSYKNEVLKNNLLILTEDKKIKEFVSASVFEAFENFVDTQMRIKKENEFSPIEIYDSLMDLLTTYEQNDWRWSLRKLEIRFRKNFFIPRLYSLSNYLYDYLILRIKEKIDFEKLKQYEIKNLKYKFKKEGKKDIYKLSVGEKVKMGYVEFDPSKSSSWQSNRIFYMGELINQLIQKPNGISFTELIKKIDGLTDNDIRSDSYYLNRRFEKAFKEGKLKIFLRIVNEGQKLRLYAFNFEPKFFKDLSPRDVNHHR